MSLLVTLHVAACSFASSLESVENQLLPRSDSSVPRRTGLSRCVMRQFGGRVGALVVLHFSQSLAL